MSAILGVYYLDGRFVDPTRLAQMATSLAHRGPDGAGVWHHEAVGLGHRMLWTTPESLQEHLPLTRRGGALALTADARIDNRDELITALSATDYPSREITDSDLILAAYDKWGSSCPQQLLGDFAFAIWDRQRQQLFCARDSMGVKPFYYYHTRGAFVFASEIKALFCLPEVPRRLSEVMVADYLVKVFEDKARTLYQDVVRLPAAHSLTVGREGFQMRQYWSVDLSQELWLSSDAEYAEALRERFTEAVRCRLRSAFPVGSMLSGGLDSSSIACTGRQVLAQEGARPLHTFSWIFPTLSKTVPQIDEQRYMDAVLTMEGFEPHYVQADTLSPLAEVLWHGEEAMPAPNLYMDCAVFSVARQENVRVVMSGIDGDTTISHGYEELPQLACTGQWKALATEVSALARRLDAPWQQIAWNFVVKPLAPAPVVRIWRVLHGQNQPSWVASSLIDPAFARRMGLAERMQVLLADALRPIYGARKHHWLSCNSGLLTYVVELLDKASAPFALEPRYPFFDRRVMEFCLALPLGQKLRHGWTRSIMRRAMEGILPREVQWRRSKGNLGANFKQRLLEDERAILEEIILSESQILEPYVDVPALQAAYGRYLSRPFHQDQDALNVFFAVVLALWLRRSGLAR